MTVLDITPFIEAESDRITSDDLIAGPASYTVARVEGRSEQDGKKRLVIHLQGASKPFIPCKGMVRLLGHLWGADLSQWVGRGLTLYRDPDVRFGKDMTGGVRICAVSDIERPATVPIRTSQKSVKAYKVDPLARQQLATPPKQSPGGDRAQIWLDGQMDQIEAAETAAILDGVMAKAGKALGKLATERPDLHEQFMSAFNARMAALQVEDDPFGGDA